MEIYDEASLNPFFIRSIVPSLPGNLTAAKAARLNPFFIRSIVPRDGW